MTRKNKRLSKLGQQFLLTHFIALVMAVVAFGIANVVERATLANLTNTNEGYIRTIEAAMADLDKYIRDNEVRVEDEVFYEKFDYWVRQRKNIFIRLYDDETVIYDSQVDDLKAISANPKRANYKIQFLDKTVEAEIICFMNFENYVLAIHLKLLWVFLVYMGVLLAFIKRKADYINNLQNEINILEGGDLDYKITIKGKDEITYLARSVEDMRITFRERLKEEEEAKEAKHMLVTSMSHDLRTPLTILIGYLEILIGRKYKSEEAFEEYSKKSLQKAYQIKEMTDRLFDYFMVYNIKQSKLDYKRYSVGVIRQMLEDNIFVLEERGFKAQLEWKAEEDIIEADIQNLHRVFDNIFSNFYKYADKNEKINICVESREDRLFIKTTNGIYQNEDFVQSSNIGFDVCKRLIMAHNGAFEYKERAGLFIVEITLPLKQLI